MKILAITMSSQHVHLQTNRENITSLGEILMDKAWSKSCVNLTEQIPLGDGIYVEVRAYLENMLSTHSPKS